MPENTGYYKKFTVIDNRTGKEVDEETFTLKLESDPLAPAALRAYIDAAANRGGYEQMVTGLTAKLEELGG
jgi:hypothetical protein